MCLIHSLCAVIARTFYTADKNAPTHIGVKDISLNALEENAEEEEEK